MQKFMILQPGQSSDQTYDLFAVVNHIGTLNSGHYTAVAKNYVDNEWYEFNDHQVTKVSKHDSSKIISKDAYVLFYQKRGIDLDNIIDYSKIKNKLTLIDGKEKFDPSLIEFPLKESRLER